MTSTLSPPSSTDAAKPPGTSKEATSESAMKSTSPSKSVAKSSATRPTSHAVPNLVFSTQAWLKLQVLCHAGETEVGAFGISDPQNLLLIQDVVTVKQSCTSVTVRFDDGAVSEFFEQQVEAGRSPQQFGRIWIHTHPGTSPEPSGTDEATFDRVFGRCDWAIMFILARGGATYCRLRLNAGPTIGAGSGSGPGNRLALSSLLDVEVDSLAQSQPGSSLLLDSWLEEYRRNVEPELSIWNEDLAYQSTSGRKSIRSNSAGAATSLDTPDASNWLDNPTHLDTFDAEMWLDCFDELDPFEQELILVELADRFDLRGRLPAACTDEMAVAAASTSGRDSGGGS